MKVIDFGSVLDVESFSDKKPFTAFYFLSPKREYEQMTAKDDSNFKFFPKFTTKDERLYNEFFTVFQSLLQIMSEKVQDYTTLGIKDTKQTLAEKAKVPLMSIIKSQL